MTNALKTSLTFAANLIPAAAVTFFVMSFGIPATLPAAGIYGLIFNNFEISLAVISTLVSAAATAYQLVVGSDNPQQDSTGTVVAPAYAHLMPALPADSHAHKAAHTPGANTKPVDVAAEEADVDAGAAQDGSPSLR